jgi:hypothetical protein
VTLGHDRTSEPSKRQMLPEILRPLCYSILKLVCAIYLFYLFVVKRFHVPTVLIMIRTALCYCHVVWQEVTRFPGVHNSFIL